MSDDGPRWRILLDRAAPTLAAVVVLLPALAVNHGRDAERSGAGAALGTPPVAGAPMPPGTPGAPDAPDAPADGAAPPAGAGPAQVAGQAPGSAPSARRPARAPGTTVVGRAGPVAVTALEQRGLSVVVRWRPEVGHPAGEYCTVVDEQSAGDQAIIDVLVNPADKAGTVRCRTSTRPTRTVTAG